MSTIIYYFWWFLYVSWGGWWLQALARWGLCCLWVFAFEKVATKDIKIKRDSHYFVE